MSWMLVFLSVFKLILCIDVQFIRDRPTIDLDFVNGALLEQHKELCDYEWIASGQEEKLKALEKVKDSLTPLLFQPPLVYGNSSYVISTFPHKDSIEAMKYCQAFGGYLAEVDDRNEFKEIQKLFMRSSVVEMLLIAGSDEFREGTWTFQRTGVALPFMSWAPGEPNNFKKSEHCLSLWRFYQGKMNDATCSFRDDKARFMCELPGST
nr:perlucin-like protein [Biomphalaria glabrata]